MRKATVVSARSVAVRIIVLGCIPGLLGSCGGSRAPDADDARHAQRREAGQAARQEPATTDARARTADPETGPPRASDETASATDEREAGTEGGESGDPAPPETLCTAEVLDEGELTAEAAAVPIDNWQGEVAAPLFEALARAERGEGQARIVFYGASHVASDLFTGYLRRALQERFGEAGPGFVLPAKPWRFYRNQMVTFERTRRWRSLRIRAHHEEAGRFGLAGVAVETDGRRRALAAFETRSDGPLTGHASRYEVFYAKQPGGGRFDVWIDGKPMRRIQTHAEAWETAYANFEVPDGPHRFEIRARVGGPVRVYGVAVERDEPGVILDTVGINGARARYHLLWDDDVYREHLARRKPDLVVLAYGTNESGDDDVPIESYEARLRQVLSRVREVVPQAACLLIGPSDRPRSTDEEGCFEDRPRTAQIVETQRKVSRDLGCGFFDLVAFMGGPLSMVRWAAAAPPYGAPDHIHYTYRGYLELGEVLHAALLDGYESPEAPADEAEDADGAGNVALGASQPQREAERSR